jgi:hypothetical protein
MEIADYSCLFHWISILIEKPCQSRESSQMLGLRVEFEWSRFPDYDVEPGEPGDPEIFMSGSADKLVAVGEADSGLRSSPLDMFPTLYIELAKSEPTIEAHKHFARKYGLLTNELEEDTTIWQDRIKKMKHLVAMVSDRREWPIRDGWFAPHEFTSGFKLRFVPRRDDENGMDLTIVPDSLYSAIALQCLSNVAKGAKVRSCKSCGELFEIHGTSGRRSNREFCSDKCRFAFNHRTRGKKQ